MKKEELIKILKSYKEHVKKYLKIFLALYYLLLLLKHLSNCMVIGSTLKVFIDKRSDFSYINTNCHNTSFSSKDFYISQGHYN